MIEENHTLDAAGAGELEMHGTPGAARVFGGIQGLGLVLAGGFGVVVSVLGISQGVTTRGVYWVAILSLLSVYAGVMAALVAWKRFGSGPALTLLISGGTAVCSGMLVDPAIATRIIGRGGNATTIAGVSLVFVGLPMIAFGMLLLLSSAVAVLGRTWSLSLKPFVLGLVWLVPAGIAVGYPLPVVGGAARGILSAVGAAPAVLAPVLYLLIGAVICVSVAVGGGLLIRSLEQGIGAGLAGGEEGGVKDPKAA